VEFHLVYSLIRPPNPPDEQSGQKATDWEREVVPDCRHEREEVHFDDGQVSEEGDCAIAECRRDGDDEDNGCYQ